MVYQVEEGFKDLAKFADNLIKQKTGHTQIQLVIEKRNKLDIYYQFDEYIKSKERKVSKATLRQQLKLPDILPRQK